MLTAMVTPFKADGSVDYDGVAKVADHLITHGNDGIVVSGTTGESPTTTTEEDGRILAAVKDAVGGRGKIVAGVGTNATAHSIELAEQAAKVGIDGVLVVTPYYNKPSQPGVQAHFRAVVEAAGLPAMLYDIPGRSGIPISLETYQAVAGHELFVAVKDATGMPTHTLPLRDLGFAVYSGDDALVNGYLAYGACGLVSVVGHVAGVQLSRVIGDFLAGNAGAALEGYREIAPAVEAIMGVPNYAAPAAKAALQHLGVLDNRRVRLPLVEHTDAEAAAVRAGLAAAGIL